MILHSNNNQKKAGVGKIKWARLLSLGAEAKEADDEATVAMKGTCKNFVVEKEGIKRSRPGKLCT